MARTRPDKQAWSEQKARQLAYPGRTNRFLEKILRSVNLAPDAGVIVLPEKLVDSGEADDADLITKIADLSREFPELGAHMRETFERLRHGVFSTGPEEPVSLSEPPDQEVRSRWTLAEYDQIINARRILYSLARTGKFPPRTLVGRTHISVSDQHKVTVSLDSFSQAIHGLDVRNLRECVVCHKLFLARRVDSVVCDPNSKCAATHAKRNERANAKLRKAIEAKKRSRKIRRTEPTQKR